MKPIDSSSAILFGLSSPRFRISRCRDAHRPKEPVDLGTRQLPVFSFQVTSSWNRISHVSASSAVLPLSTLRSAPLPLFLVGFAATALCELLLISVQYLAPLANGSQKPIPLSLIIFKDVALFRKIVPSCRSDNVCALRCRFLPLAELTVKAVIISDMH